MTIIDDDDNDDDDNIVELRRQLLDLEYTCLQDDGVIPSLMA